MTIGKTISFGLIALLIAGAVFILGQNASLSPPKSLGYQNGQITGGEFSSGRYSAASYINVKLANGELAKIAVDASFSTPKIGQSVCIHAATGWFSNARVYRFSRPQKCAS